MGDSEGVLERSIRAGDHDRLVVLEPRPFAVDALDELDRQERVHGALHGDAADLALAHGVVPVADREERALDVDAEVNRGPGSRFGRVHVPAKGLRHQDVPRLRRSRRNADRPQERLERQADRILGVEGSVGYLAGAAVDRVDPRLLRKRLLEGRRELGARE